MFRNMVTSLFKHEQIQTTDAKAKELRRWADQLVTLAKRGDLHARRQAMAIIREKEVVHKLFEDAPKRFADVNGGYTRIVKVGYRPGDAAAVSLVQLVSPEPKKKKKPRRRKKAAPAVETPQATETKDAKISAADEVAAAEPAEAEAAPETPEAEAAAESTAETAPEAADEAVEAEAASAAASDETPAEAAEPETKGSEKKEEK
jgi:large subunit ribosomal protein L17